MARVEIATFFLLFVSTLHSEPTKIVIQKGLMYQTWSYDDRGRKHDDGLDAANYDLTPILVSDQEIVLRNQRDYTVKNPTAAKEYYYEIVDGVKWRSRRVLYAEPAVTFQTSTKIVDSNGFESYANDLFVLATVPGENVYIFRGVLKDHKPAPNELGLHNIVWTDRRLDSWSKTDGKVAWSELTRDVYTTAQPNTIQWPLYNTVKKITADSELTETIGSEKVVYAAKNTAINFTVNEGGEKNFVQLPPWVEAVSGPGIGQSLHAEFWEPFNNLIILNGYVDLLNPQLYKQNNRVKDMLIAGKDDQGKKLFELTIQFVDIPSFQKFRLPRAVKFVDLTILSVYPGTKYDDTCIRSVFSWPYD